MTNDHTTSQPFSQRYESALELHLSKISHTQLKSESARALGLEAFESGIGVLDLARIHDQSMERIPEAQHRGKPPHSKDGVSSGGFFLIESMTSIEEQNLQKRHDVFDALCISEKKLAQSESTQKRSQELAQQILVAQEEERKEISRELHDEVAQILAGINVRLAALREVGAISFQSLEQGIEQAQKLIEESVNVVHRFARKLRPSMLDDLGLIPALRSFIKELPRPKGLDIQFKHVIEVEEMDTLRRTVFYRVAQESILNIVRHAEAAHATVELKKIPDGIRLEISDDGKSFLMDQISEFKNYKRLGLLGMKERVEMVSGTFLIESSLGTGTTVRVDIPFFSEC